MSAFSDAMGAIRSVLVMQANQERMDREIERFATDLASLRDIIIAVDRRVARIEGVMEGYGRAAQGAAPQRRLPKE